MDAVKLRTELIRKSIHMLIAFSPALAAWNRPTTLALLAGGVLAYAAFEGLRFAGHGVPGVAALTALASRPRDRGRFVLGPVTLGLGALLPLALFPLPAATVAVYALAFGDAFSGLVGRVFGRLRPAFLRGKSIEGCLACLTAVFVAALAATGRPLVALTAALVATVVEALPLRDWDNLVFPLVVGLAVLPFFTAA